jgi:hypothetical protein
MLSKIKALPKLAAALAVAVALTFGTTEALMGDRSPCTPLPPHTCKYEQDPDAYCLALCIANSYPPDDAECVLQYDCCQCLER